jgi:DNA-binding MarR family transcriptional regulator
MTATQEPALERIGLAVRRLGAQSVLSGALMARAFGLHTTDLEVLDLIHLRGEPTVGELARATGLTSGSMTALVDRLILRGFVTRHEDPRDRRRTLVRIDEDATREIAAAYAPRQVSMQAFWATFSAVELATIEKFLRGSTERLVELTAASEIAHKTKSQGPVPKIVA